MLCSACCLPALFHAESVHGVCLSRGFPPTVAFPAVLACLLRRLRPALSASWASSLRLRSACPLCPLLLPRSCRSVSQAPLARLALFTLASCAPPGPPTTPSLSPEGDPNAAVDRHACRSIGALRVAASIGSVPSDPCYQVPDARSSPELCPLRGVPPACLGGAAAPRPASCASLLATSLAPIRVASSLRSRCDLPRSPGRFRFARSPPPLLGFDTFARPALSLRCLRCRCSIASARRRRRSRAVVAAWPPFPAWSSTLSGSASSLLVAA